MQKKKVTFEDLFGFKKMQEISLERLQPPRAPIVNRVELSVREDHYKEISSETSGGTKDTVVNDVVQDQHSKLGIDPFVWLSSNHSFQMVLYEFMKKFAPGLERIKTRGTKKVLKNCFSKARQDLMKELKQVLELRKK